jgi:hypothetical protein
MLLKTIISPRTIVFLTLVMAFLIRFNGYDAMFGNLLEFLQLLILILVAGALSISVSAFGAFDIESKRAFVWDIILDVIVFGFAIWMLTYLLTLQVYGARVSVQALYLTFTAVGLSVLDFLISLNGGAGKLLEMDREHFTRDR